MLMEVGEFCRSVGHDLDQLVDKLQAVTGRRGEEERWAWRTSLDRAARVLDSPALSDFHLHVGQRGGVSIEYQLPASGSWCDLVLLGDGTAAPQAIVVEFKGWDTYGDRPGPTDRLVWHGNDLLLHPSDQVGGYVEYCRHFHSGVLDHGASVEGCVYFTQPQSA